MSLPDLPLPEGRPPRPVPPYSVSADGDYLMALAGGAVSYGYPESSTTRW